MTGMPGATELDGFRCRPLASSRSISLTVETAECRTTAFGPTRAICCTSEGTLARFALDQCGRSDILDYVNAMSSFERAQCGDDQAAAWRACGGSIAG